MHKYSGHCVQVNGKQLGKLYGDGSLNSQIDSKKATLLTESLQKRLPANQEKNSCHFNRGLICKNRQLKPCIVWS